MRWLRRRLAWRRGFERSVFRIDRWCYRLRELYRGDWEVIICNLEAIRRNTRSSCQDQEVYMIQTRQKPVKQPRPQSATARVSMYARSKCVNSRWNAAIFRKVLQYVFICVKISLHCEAKSPALAGLSNHSLFRCLCMAYRSSLCRSGEGLDFGLRFFPIFNARVVVNISR